MTCPQIFTRLAQCVFVVLLATAWSDSAAGADRSALRGYGSFSFGESMAVVKGRIKVASESTDSISEFGELRLVDEQGAVKVRDIDFRRRFGFRDNKLVLIQLLKETPDTVHACESSFDRILGLLKIQYGSPDSDVKPEGDSFGLSTFWNARFTFEDSATIVLASFWLASGMTSSGCNIIVTYGAPLGGGSF